jgi:hypothetical protein
MMPTDRTQIHGQPIRVSIPIALLSQGRPWQSDLRSWPIRSADPHLKTTLRNRFSRNKMNEVIFGECPIARQYYLNSMPIRQHNDNCSTAER